MIYYYDVIALLMYLLIANIVIWYLSMSLYNIMLKCWIHSNDIILLCNGLCCVTLFDSNRVHCLQQVITHGIQYWVYTQDYR